MKNLLLLLYGFACYLVFTISLLYLNGFVGNLVVPRSIDLGMEASPAQSLIINVFILSLFAVQHTIMARPAVKQWWTRIIPVQMERSEFVLVASLLLLLICWQWRAMTGVIWNVENNLGKAVLHGLHWLGWSTLLFSSFIINHFDLFGLRQVWLHFRSQESQPVEFQTKSLYRYLRHPIMLGFVIAFWATPEMTTGHPLFAARNTIYILIGIQFEERDLMHFLGTDYEDYRNQVPMLLPFGRKQSQALPAKKHASP
jgi:protein-S-isoprenylcysteine O-methyltransferase Ste14